MKKKKKHHKTETKISEVVFIYFLYYWQFLEVAILKQVSDDFSQKKILYLQNKTGVLFLNSAGDEIQFLRKICFENVLNRTF